MTRRTPAVEPHQIDQLRSQAHQAIDALCTRALTIQTLRSRWARGYPGGQTGAGYTTDPMAEHVAKTLSPLLDADDQPVLDPNGNPVWPRPEPDPALAATRWCADFTELFALMWRLEDRALRLIAACAHTTNGRRCATPATIGDYCATHAPRCRGCNQAATYNGWCDKHSEQATDPAVASTTKPSRCVCCADLIAGPSRRGLCEPCYRSWKREERKGEDFDTWNRKRRALYAIELRGSA